MHQVLFFVCTETQHSQHLSTHLLILNKPQHLFVVSQDLVHALQAEGPAWQGPGVLMSYKPHLASVSRRLQHNTQNRTSQGFHGLFQLFIEH